MFVHAGENMPWNTCFAAKRRTLFWQTYATDCFGISCLVENKVQVERMRNWSLAEQVHSCCGQSLLLSGANMYYFQYRCFVQWLYQFSNALQEEQLKMQPKDVGCITSAHNTCGFFLSCSVCLIFGESVWSIFPVPESSPPVAVKLQKQVESDLSRW